MKLKKMDTEKLIFLTLLTGILGFIFNVSYIDYSKIAIMLRFFSLGILGIILIKNNVSVPKELCLVIILLGILLLINRKNEIFYVIYYLLFTLASKDIKYSIFIKKLWKINLLSLSIIFILNFLGIFKSPIYYGFYGEERILRRTYGLVTPNIAFSFILSVIIIGMIRYKFNYKSIFLSSLSLFYFNNLIKSRNGFIVGVLIVFFSFFYKKIFMSKNIKRIYLLMPLILFLFLLFIATDLEKFNNLDILLSNRPYYYKKFFKESNIINLFLGNYEIYYPLDNSYLRILYSCGIIILIYYSIIITRVSSFFLRHKKPEIVIIISLLGVYFNLEAFLIVQGYPISYFFWYLLLNYKKIVKPPSIKRQVKNGKKMFNQYNCPSL